MTRGKVGDDVKAPGIFAAFSVAECPKMAYLWDSSYEKSCKINEKATPGAGHAKYLYGTVDSKRPPRRRRNAELRSREYLTDAEVNRLIAAAGDNRNGHRDATMVLVAYRHGLRAAEVVTLRWDAIDFNHGRLHVSRIKSSADSVHPLSG